VELLFNRDEFCSNPSKTGRPICNWAGFGSRLAALAAGFASDSLLDEVTEIHPLTEKASISWQRLGFCAAEGAGSSLALEGTR